MIKPRTRKRDGRRVYDVRLRDPDGKEYGKTFETRKQAEAWEAAEKTARNTGQWIDPRRGDIDCNQLCDDWLRSNPSKRTRSVLTSKCHLDHFRRRFGKRAIASITRADVQQLVDTWKTTHAPSTLVRMYSTVSAIFNYAEAAELIVRSPCRQIRLPTVPIVERPTLTVDELERLADALGPDWAPMLWIGVVLGLRWGEVAGLTVGSINPLRGTLSVTAQLSRDRELSEPKTAGSRRTMAVPRWLLDELGALLARRGLTGADRDRLVFVNTRGGAVSYSPWRRQVWMPACQAAGLDGLRFHDLRSMAATAMIASGVDPKTAQHRLGHTSPVTTLRIYARATADADQNAAEKVGQLFGRAMDARWASKSNPLLYPCTPSDLAFCSQRQRDSAACRYR
jgi:integrase